MDGLPSHGFQAAADSPSGIIFNPDIFNCDVRPSNTLTGRGAQRQSLSMAKEPRREVGNGQVSNAKSKSPRPGPHKGDRHVAFQDGQIKRRLSSIHPALRPRPTSGRAGDIATVDDRIARNGGTTSTYEQLPHRLRISKQRRPVSSKERVVELTRTNGYLLQELAYYKDIQKADMDFYVTMMDLHAKLGDALKERSQKREDAESTLLTYWGIDFGDGNVEDVVF